MYLLFCHATVHIATFLPMKQREAFAVKLPIARWILALAACLVLGTPAGASVIASNVVTVATANGSITVTSTVDDEFFGDASRWLFQYEVSGNYDPFPPDTNGISSLQIFFGGLLDDVTGQAGPPGWILNATSVAPPLGAGWDLPNSAGYGAGPNGAATLYFAAPAGTPFTSESQGSYAGSHYYDIPFGLMLLVDAASGQGPIVPVPEPTSLLLIAGGLALLRGRRPA
jgi:hypothetical protein